MNMTTLMPPAVPAALSQNDTRVLSALFDPEADSSNNTSSSNNTTACPDATPDNLDSSFSSSAYSAAETTLPGISPAELPSIIAAERAALHPLNTSEDASPPEDVIQSVISALSDIVARFPEYAPAYVNRAQARRLLLQQNYDAEVRRKRLVASGEGDDNDNNNNNNDNDSNNIDNRLTSTATSDSPHDQTIAEIVTDINKAIQLASPVENNQETIDSTLSATLNTKHRTTHKEGSHSAQQVSAMQARVLSAAHSHQGYIYLQAARASRAQSSDNPYMSILKNVLNMPELYPSRTEETSHPFKTLSRSQLEEMASHHFAIAGRYGDRTAKEAAVALNPYARMCGAIVKNAMKEELDLASGASKYSC